MNYSLPGSSVFEIFQVRRLEWVAISSSRGSSRLRDQDASPVSPALSGSFFTIVPREVKPPGLAPGHKEPHVATRLAFFP